eukprot:scaffold106_cov246-Pinguiococcus_pyrenoidosus.AAC.22
MGCDAGTLLVEGAERCGAAFAFSLCAASIRSKRSILELRLLGDRCFGTAALTSTSLPSMTCDGIPMAWAAALLPSSLIAKTMKPKPLDLPVSRLYMTSEDKTSPNCPKYSPRPAEAPRDKAQS